MLARVGVGWWVLVLAWVGECWCWRGLVLASVDVGEC